MRKAICEYCGKEYIKKNKNSRCCSQECNQALYRQEHRVVHTKVCVICGRKFETTKSAAKYCSSLCACEARRRKSLEYAKRVSHEPRKCTECGGEFIPKSVAGKFCSKECKKIHTSKRMKQGFKPIKCVYCGKEFIPNSSSAKYCSEECRKEGKRDALRKKVSAHDRNPGAESKKKTEKKSPAQLRWEKMTWKEISAECARFHLTYGQVQVMAMRGTLPEDFGLRKIPQNKKEAKAELERRKSVERITVIICEPGMLPRIDRIENTLETMQEIVGGYIETVTFAEDCCIVCNEEGRLKGLAPCMKLFGVDFAGTCMVVGVKGDKFCSVPSNAYNLLFSNKKG